MKVIDDGVIKYDRSNFTQCGPLAAEEFTDLEYWRKKLYQINLIGEYPDVHIGFGNMSTVRDYQRFLAGPHPQFIITGTQTGKYPELSGLHYTRVLNYKIDELKIFMMGPVEASSEALTHAAIYAINSNIKAIFHIHSATIWKGMINDKSNFTAADTPYGTVEMALATQECIKGLDYGTFCMHGHEDGVVIFGRSIDETGKLTLELYEKYFKKV